MQINKETIEQLFRQHYLRMYQLARVLLKDDAASKDVVSEVFADVLDGKTQLGLDNETITSDSPLPSTNAGSYLLVCVRHKCLNLLSPGSSPPESRYFAFDSSPGSDDCRNKQGDRKVRGNSGLYGC